MKRISNVVLISLLLSPLQSVYPTDAAVAHAHFMKGDFEAAYREYRALAEVGYGRYLRQIAQMHAEGLGVKQDLVEAYAWYSLATSEGDLNGKKQLQILVHKMAQKQRSDGLELAHAYGKLYVSPYRPRWKLENQE